MFACVQSCVYQGLMTTSVAVECDLSRGLAVFNVVGLASNAVSEARIRARSALVNSGYKFPVRRVTVNLSPANLRKDGCHLDLPIALAILMSDEQIPRSALDGVLVLGELGLNGAVRPSGGILTMALHAHKNGFQKIIVAAQSMSEACVIDGLTVFGARHLTDVVEWAHGRRALEMAVHTHLPESPACTPYDMKDIHGQPEARRALEIAAAGGHNVLLSGPPGCGKSMLAKRLAGIMPPLTLDEQIECTTIASVSGLLGSTSGLVTKRPFRSPHQTASPAALSGGGVNATPGEVSLAHNGVLFLDELPEFAKRALEALRQPLEDGYITISRAGNRFTYPAKFVFVGAMNPCPCGYLDHPRRQCLCHPDSVRRYRKRISGPLLDRIDLHLRIEPLRLPLEQHEPSESSAQIRERVRKTRALQTVRLREHGIRCNAELNADTIRMFCQLDEASKDFMNRVMNRFDLSSRAHHRILKVARTIADLAGDLDVKANHLAEAAHFRLPTETATP